MSLGNKNVLLSSRWLPCVYIPRAPSRSLHNPYIPWKLIHFSYNYLIFSQGHLVRSPWKLYTSRMPSTLRSLRSTFAIPYPPPPVCAPFLILSPCYCCARMKKPTIFQWRHRYKSMGVDARAVRGVSTWCDDGGDGGGEEIEGGIEVKKNEKEERMSAALDWSDLFARWQSTCCLTVASSLFLLHSFPPLAISVLSLRVYVFCGWCWCSTLVHI